MPSPIRVHAPAAVDVLQVDVDDAVDDRLEPAEPGPAAGSSIAALPGSQITRSCDVSAAASAACASAAVATLHSCSFSSASVTPAACVRASRRGACAEVVQGRGRIALAPVAERAHDRRLEHGRDVQRPLEDRVLIVAAVALEERGGDRADGEAAPVELRSDRLELGVGVVDDLRAVERAQLDGVELELLAHVERTREARVDLVGDDAQPHRPCLYQLAEKRLGGLRTRGPSPQAPHEPFEWGCALLWTRARLPC